MAKPFEKGNQYGKLGGRPSLPEEIKELREVSKAMMVETMAEYFHLPVSRIAEIMKDQSQPAYRAMCARVIFRAIAEGDPRMVDYICERFLELKKTKTIDIEALPKDKVIEMAKESLRLLEGS